MTPNPLAEPDPFAEPMTVRHSSQSILTYSKVTRGIAGNTPTVSYAVIAAVPLTLLVLSALFASDWKAVLWVTAVGGGLATVIALWGTWSSNLRRDVHRNLLALLLAVGTSGTGLLLIRLDTPFYRRTMYNVKCQPGLTAETARAIRLKATSIAPSSVFPIDQNLRTGVSPARSND